VKKAMCVIRCKRDKVTVVIAYGPNVTRTEEGRGRDYVAVEEGCVQFSYRMKRRSRVVHFIARCLQLQQQRLLVELPSLVEPEAVVRLAKIRPLTGASPT
jgi:hypothetical protein